MGEGCYRVWLAAHVETNLRNGMVKRAEPLGLDAWRYTAVA